MKNSRRLVECRFCWFLISSLACAQTTGELRGIISDPSGLPVPDCKVSLVSRETGEARSQRTDQAGRYAFRLLKVGEHLVTVEAEGFRRAVALAQVRSAEIASVNLTLEVGQVTEQVTVLDAASALDTQSAQVQESFDPKRVAEIPVTRNPNNLAATLPGIVPAVAGFNSGSFLSHGNRARANNITIDNITATDISVAGTGSTNNGPLNFSSIKEVKIISNTFSAEFGRNAGSQVQYITRSGTNQWHGEAYDYLRNNRFNARDWFDRTGSATVIRYNQFGGVLGGPIVPNRTHFFVSAEGAPQRGSGGARIAQVPTAAMLARVTDPTSKKLLDQYKLPAAATELANFGNVQQNAPNKTDFHQYSVRVDHQLSPRDSLFARVGSAYNEGTNSTNTFIGTNLGNFGLVSTNTVYSANLNETHIFSASVINEFRGGFGRTSPVFGFGTTVPLGPRIEFSNGQVDRFGHWEGAPQGRVQNTYQFGDTLTFTRGAHNVKLGGDFFRYQANSSLDSDARGRYQFLNWDDFAAGRPNFYTQRFGSTVRGHRTWLAGFFAQDDYRVTRDLTLNLGLRAEIYGPVSEVNGLTSNLDFNCRDSLGAAGSGPLGCFTIGRDSISTNRYLQPRVGLAWNPGGGKTVIRAGYGLVADFNFLNPITNQRGLPPFVVTQSITGVDNFTGGNTWANLIAGTAPVQQGSAALVGRIRGDVRNYGDINPVIDPSLANPQVHQWSLGVERELPHQFVLKVAYHGTKGNYLQRARQVNLNANRPAPAASLADELARRTQFLGSYNALSGSSTSPSGRTDPRFNVVNYNDSSANSNYHGLEVLGLRQFRSGYSLQVAYTFAKSIDDVSDSLVNVPNDSALLQNPLNTRENRAVSGFDLAHRFVTTHVWELPWGARASNPVARRILEGWGFSGISSFRTGFPISLEAGPRLGVQNIPVISTGGIVRPNAAGPVRLDPRPVGSAGAPNGLNADPETARRISSYAESLGLSQPLLGNFGTLGRNANRASGQVNFDWNVYKNTRITERVSVQLRCEMYNVFNNHSFQDMNRNISNPGFGQYTTPAQSQRLLQLGAVVRF